MELRQPGECVVQDVLADRAGRLAVQVDQVAPRVAVGLEVWAEACQIVAGGAEVVVDDVERHGQSCPVAGINETFQTVRAAIDLVLGEPEHAVIPPVPLPVEVVDRQDLHVGNAQPYEVVEPFDRGIEGASCRERADVQLVEHGAGKAMSGPAGVGPGKVVGIEPAHGVNTVRLTPRSRVRQHLLVLIQPESVVAARQGFGHVRLPPAAISGFEVSGHHRVTKRLSGFAGLYRDTNPSGVRRPDAHFGHRASGLRGAHQGFSASSRATGYRERASATDSTPSYLAPVNTSRYWPGGRGRLASPQPPDADRPAGSRVAMVMAPPRSNATR